MSQYAESQQIMLFHDFLFGNRTQSIVAQSQLISQHRFTHNKLPASKGTMMDGVLKGDMEKQYIFRPVVDNTYAFLDKSKYDMPAKKVYKTKDIPIVKADYGRVKIDNTYVRKNPLTEYVTQNWVQLSTTGLGVIDNGTSVYLKVKNFDVFKAAVQNGQFVANWNGKKVWKIGFRGNQSVPAKIVAAEKAAFSASYKTMKWVGVAGKAASGLGIGLSIYDANKKGWTSEAPAKLTLDVIMTGVAIVPAVGWVISGLYFITDAALTLSGHDWWHVVWKDFILPTSQSLKEAARHYYEARKIMYIP